MTKSSFIHDQGIGISSIRPENPPSNLLAAVWTEREPLSHRNPGEFFYRLKLTLAAGSVPRLRAPKGVQAPPTSPLRALPRLMSDASTESLVLLVQISHTPLILFFFLTVPMPRDPQRNTPVLYGWKRSSGMSHPGSKERF